MRIKEAIEAIGFALYERTATSSTYYGVDEHDPEFALDLAIEDAKASVLLAKWDIFRTELEEELNIESNHWTVDLEEAKNRLEELLAKKNA